MSLCSTSGHCSCSPSPWPSSSIMETNDAISINLVVLNGERYVRHCLESILKQTAVRECIELNILDNGSTDRTRDIIREYLPKFEGFHHVRFIESPQNHGMWGGQEELLK